MMTRPRKVFTWFLALTLSALLAACSSAPLTGSLAVTLTGLPGGMAGSVLVTGPNGYSQTITTTTTLSVTPGSYSVTVSAVRGNDSIVPPVYDGNAAPTTATVTAGSTTPMAVTYALRPGSGMLWIPLWGDSFEAVGYARSQLLTSGSPTPDVSLAGTTNLGEGIAFDGEGNMWVSDMGGYLYRYDAASLASSGAPTPAVTIDATAYGSLAGLAFDASGNLWTADFMGNRVLGYSPAQLAVSGAPAAAVVISTNSGSLTWPVGIAFDAGGNLWVSNLFANTVVRFSSAQLAVTGSPVPTATLSASGGSLAEPYQLAFDADGNLWVSNISTPNTVVRFDAAQLAGSGSPTPAATIAGSSLGVGIAGIAFDASGALWVAANNGLGATSEIRRFTNPGALTGSAAPTASVIITSIGKADAMNMAFNPAPANLPINTP